MVITCLLVSNSDMISDVMVTSSSSPSRRLLLSPVLCINDGGRAEVLLRTKTRRLQDAGS